MNVTQRRLAAAVATLGAVSVLTACGGGSDDKAVQDAQHTLAAPSGPGSFVGGADARGKAYVAQIRSDQSSGRSKNQNLTALTDEQLLAIGKGTCTAKEQGATNDQIEKALADGMSGVSASDVAPYVESAISTLCAPN